MLVVISDIHLTDGSSGDTVREGAFRLFRDTLRDLAYDASWDRDGRYRPIPELHLLLLGDVLDVIRSRRWLDGAVRPWGDWSSPAFAGKVAEITSAILASYAGSLQVLRDLDVGGDVTIPPATLDHRPADVDWEPWNPRRQRIKVHRHYMVGNHDWFYHLPGPEYDAIRGLIAQEMGLDNPPGAPFPWGPLESSTIREVCREHRVLARHGDVYDRENFNPARGRNGASIGDAIVVELITRFRVQAEQDLRGEISPECLRGLNELDHIRPAAMSVVWIAGLLKRTCRSREERRRVKRVWNRIVGEFLRIPFVRAEPSRTKLVWRISRWLSLEALSWLLVSCLGWIFQAGRSQPDYKDAAADATSVKQAADFIVYGHTHTYELVPLVSSKTAKPAQQQVYLNSGTWRTYHELARANPQRREFLSYELMTMLAFYREGERGGRMFEAWNGTLSPAPGGSGTIPKSP